MHRRPTFQPRLPDRSPTCVGNPSSGSAFLPTSDSHQLLDPGSPADQPPTCVGNQSSGSAFRSTFDLRLRSTLQLRLRIDLRLSPPTDPSAMPSDRPPACAFDQSSSSTFQLTLGLASLDQSSGSAFEPNLQLVTVAASSDLVFALALSFRLGSTLDCAFCLASSLRLPPNFQPHLRTQPPTFIGCCVRQRYLPIDLQLSSSNLSSGSAFRLTFDLRLRSILQPYP